MKLSLLSLLFAVAAFSQTHSATLTWTDAANPAGTTHNVYRATGACGGTQTFSVVGPNVAANTYQDTTVLPGIYCYYVTAGQAATESKPSNQLPAPVLNFPPNLTTVVVQ